MNGRILLACHFKRFAFIALLGVGIGVTASAGYAEYTNDQSARIAKGEYLARAGDCVACHTVAEGKLFAGGRAMPTPFGTLYTSNITPDDETGIGTWNADQFYRMMHTGRFPDGGLLYPAMPFGSYTKVTREDSDAIFAYLKSIPPVKQVSRPHDLNFPYNNRSLILGWRTLFFTEGEFEPNPKQSDEWNRGAYLVEGLGHCAMCHTAINALGGSSEFPGLPGGPYPHAELVCAFADLEQGGRPRRLEHQGHHRSLEDRRLAARRGIRTDGRGRL